ncbi:MAG: hypothetical protein WCS42_08160 [Verrucomicrobiota bacterium]
MKNTPRIQQNTATKTVASQSKTYSRQQEIKDQNEWQRLMDEEFAEPKDGNLHSSCLAIYDRMGKGVAAKVPLSDADFTEIMMLTAGQPDGAGNFFANAIREKLSRIRELSNRVARAAACAGSGN